MSISASVQLSLYPLLPIAEETEKSYLLPTYHVLIAFMLLYILEWFEDSRLSEWIFK